MDRRLATTVGGKIRRSFEAQATQCATSAHEPRSKRVLGLLLRLSDMNLSPRSRGGEFPWARTSTRRRRGMAVFLRFVPTLHNSEIYLSFKCIHAHYRDPHVVSDAEFFSPSSPDELPAC